FATRFVTPRLFDDVFSGKWWNAETLPQHLPQRARVADVVLADDQHLPEGLGEHVEMTDRGLVSVAGGDDGVEDLKRASAVFCRDSVGEFVERALLGGEHHGLHVAQRYALLFANV